MERELYGLWPPPTGDEKPPVGFNDLHCVGLDMELRHDARMRGTHGRSIEIDTSTFKGDCLSELTTDADLSAQLRGLITLYTIDGFNVACRVAEKRTFTARRITEDRILQEECRIFAVDYAVEKFHKVLNGDPALKARVLRTLPSHERALSALGSLIRPDPRVPDGHVYFGDLPPHGHPIDPSRLTKVEGLSTTRTYDSGYSNESDRYSRFRLRHLLPGAPQIIEVFVRKTDGLDHEELPVEGWVVHVDEHEIIMNLDGLLPNEIYRVHAAHTQPRAFDEPVSPAKPEKSAFLQALEEIE